MDFYMEFEQNQVSYGEHGEEAQRLMKISNWLGIHHGLIKPDWKQQMKTDKSQLLVDNMADNGLGF